MSRVVLDLNNRHFVRERGALTIIGTWVRMDDGIEPCLAIVRTGYETDYEPCIVPLPAIHNWDMDDLGENGAPDCLLTAMEFVMTLGFGADSDMVSKLMLFVWDTMGDLISIPPSTQLDELEAERAELEALFYDKTTGKKMEVLI